MDVRSRTIDPACVQSRVAQTNRGLRKRPVELKLYYKTLLSENLGTHCREWPAENANAEVQMLVEANSKPHDIVTYTDGSVTRDRSGWGVTIKQGGGRTVHEGQWNPQCHDLKPDHRGRSSHKCNTVASPPSVTHRLHMPSLSQTQ